MVRALRARFLNREKTDLFCFFGLDQHHILAKGVAIQLRAVACVPFL